jgi:hypothetical protein
MSDTNTTDLLNEASTAQPKRAEELYRQILNTPHGKLMLSGSTMYWVVLTKTSVVLINVNTPSLPL